MENAVIQNKRPPLDKLIQLCDGRLAELLCQCWSPEPDLRPTFQAILSTISNLTHRKGGVPGVQLKARIICPIRQLPSFRNCEEFGPIVTNRRSAGFAGGSGANFTLAEVDGEPAVVKEFSVPNEFPLKAKMVLDEVIMLKKFSAVPTINRYFYHTFKGGQITLYVSERSTSLKAVIQERKAADPISYFSVGECSKIALAVASALWAIHTYSPEDPIVHRDVKVRNLNSLLMISLT